MKSAALAAMNSRVLPWPVILALSALLALLVSVPSFH